MDFLTQLYRRVTRRLSPKEMAAQELYEAEMSRLQALTAMEYASSMVQYHDSRIARLRDFLKNGD